MDKPWKVVSAFVGVFIAGAVFGGLFTLRASNKRFAADTKSVNTKAQAVTSPQAVPAALPPRGNPITPQLMRQFTQRLNLTPEQKRRIMIPVSRAGEDLHRLRQENLADTARVTERMYADVSEILSPEQRAELENMRKQMKERVEAERKRRAEAAQAEMAARAAAETNARQSEQRRSTEKP